jgi:hypothetical protein
MNQENTIRTNRMVFFLARSVAMVSGKASLPSALKDFQA